MQLNLQIYSFHNEKSIPTIPGLPQSIGSFLQKKGEGLKFKGLIIS